MGIGTLLKAILPITFYSGAMLLALIAMSGRTKWALYLLIFLLPLRNIVEKIQELPFGDQLTDILIISILLGTIVRLSTDKLVPAVKSSINSLSISLIIYLIISWVWGTFYLSNGFDAPDQAERMQDCKNVCLLPIIYFLVSKNVTTKQEVRNLFCVVCCAILVVAYYTILQISYYSDLLSRAKISGTFQFLGPNEVGAFLNTYTVIMISIMYFLKSKRFKLILLGFIVVNLYCITFLYSRGAYAALLFGLIILFAIKDKKMLIPIILILVCWQTVLPEKVIARIKETQDQAGQLDESSGKRIEMWQNALALFQGSPVLGTGFGTFRFMGYSLKDTHNIYMKILSEQGLVGIFIFFALLVAFMREGFKLYQKGDDEFSKGLGLGFFVAIFVVAVNNLFGDRWSYLEPNAFLWVLTGLVARSNSLIGHVPKPLPVKKSKPHVNIEEVKPKKVRYYDPS